MLFNSYIFVLLFLPASILGYYLLNRLKQYALAKVFLLLMSIWFYGYFNYAYLPLILGSIFVNFTINKLLHRDLKSFIRKTILIIGILLNVGVLFYYKYYDFFVSNINNVFESNFNLQYLILPLGISFFTFQQLSYVIDSYKKQVPDYNLLDYSLFVSFFPQLIAGPIVLHNEIVPQFADKTKKIFCYENFSKGIMAFAFGLAKKVLIADTFGNAVNLGYSNVDILGTTNGIIVMLAYTLQIYFDFSGYCDMATGMGLMFNIVIPMNFNSPYKSFTITEFWKRWHLTLTRFFTFYVYIPLGGNKKGTIRTYLNIFTVFLVSGLWHGANWTFILWGLLHGVASVITRLFQKRIDKFHPAFNWLTTFLFVNLTWIYFRAENIQQGTRIIKNMMHMNFGPINTDISNSFILPEFKFVLRILSMDAFITYMPHFFMTAFFVFSLIAILTLKNTNERIDAFKPSSVSITVVSALLIWTILSFTGVSTFLYFNF